MPTLSGIAEESALKKGKKRVWSDDYLNNNDNNDENEVNSPYKKRKENDHKTTSDRQIVLSFSGFGGNTNKDYSLKRKEELINAAQRLFGCKVQDSLDPSVTHVVRFFSYFMIIFNNFYFDYEN